MVQVRFAVWYLRHKACRNPVWILSLARGVVIPSPQRYTRTRPRPMCAGRRPLNRLIGPLPPQHLPRRQRRIANEGLAPTPLFVSIEPDALLRPQDVGVDVLRITLDASIDVADRLVRMTQELPQDRLRVDRREVGSSAHSEHRRPISLDAPPGKSFRHRGGIGG